MSFGAKLKALREERGMSVRELSRKADLALSHLQYLESDAKIPRERTLGRLAKALGVPVADLRTERITGQITLLLREAGKLGTLSDAQRQEILDGLDRVAKKG